MNSPFVETNLQSYLTFSCDNAIKTFGELREELRTDLELHLKIKGENNMIAGMPWIINKETTGASITVDCKDIWIPLMMRYWKKGMTACITLSSRQHNIKHNLFAIQKSNKDSIKLAIKE